MNIRQMQKILILMWVFVVAGGLYAVSRVDDEMFCYGFLFGVIYMFLIIWIIHKLDQLEYASVKKFKVEKRKRDHERSVSSSGTRTPAKF